MFNQMFREKPNEHWKDGILADLADITMGQSPAGASLNENGNGIVFYQGRTEFGHRFPSIRLYTTAPTRFAQKGDILMSVRAPVGDMNIALEKCCIGRGISAIRSKTNSQSFVFYLLRSLKEQIDVFNGQGTVFGSINRDNLKGLSVAIPDETSITRFEAEASKLDALILANEMENRRLMSVRDSLLPKLMSGEINVDDIEV